MLHKNSSDLLCIICAAPATKRMKDKPVCDDCSQKPEIKEYLDRLDKFE